VAIWTRTPGFDKLVGSRVKAGGEEFGDKFTVTCARPEEALNSVNAEVERILLQHAAGPGWTLRVTIAAAASWYRVAGRRRSRTGLSDRASQETPVGAALETAGGRG